MACVIKEDGQFQSQIVFEDEALLNKHGIQQEGGIGACQNIRTKEQNICLLIKQGNIITDKVGKLVDGVKMFLVYISSI